MLHDHLTKTMPTMRWTWRLLLLTALVSLTAITMAATLLAPTLVYPPDAGLHLPSHTSNVRGSGLNMVWNDPSDGATLYWLQVSTTADMNRTIIDDKRITLNVARGNLQMLSHGQLYYWRVCAGDGTNWGPWSAIWSFTTEPTFDGRDGLNWDCAADYPNLLTPYYGAMRLPLTGQQLTWQKMYYKAPAMATGWLQYQLKQLGQQQGLTEAQYCAQVATDANFTTLIVDQSGISSGATDTVSLALPTLNAATRYYWRVRAGDGATWGPWAPALWFNTYDLTAPALLTPADAATDVTTPVTVTWAPAASATLYHLQVATSPAFTTLIVEQRNLATTSAALPALRPNTPYYWRVRASDGTVWSVWSAVWSFTPAAVHSIDLMVDDVDGPIGDGTIDAPGTMVVDRVNYNNRPSIYLLTMRNDGNTPDAFMVTGDAGKVGWQVHYFASSGKEITRWVTSRGYATSTIPVGGTVTIRLEVTPASAVKAGDFLAVNITATSTADTRKLDTIQTMTTKIGRGG